MAAIQPAEILFKLSNPAATAGNQLAQADPDASLGLYVSTSTFSGLNGLFDDVSGAEAAAGDVEYRCIFVHNSNTSNALEGAAIWFSADNTDQAAVALAVDNIAASGVASGTAQADSVGDENTAPDAVGAFSTPTTEGGAVSLGDIPANNVKAVWIRRTVTAGASADADENISLSVSGDTGAA